MMSWPRGLRTGAVRPPSARIVENRSIDAALEHGGRYYLPYRLHATPAQFARAYPEYEAFRRLKARLDPRGKFRNMLWDRYL